MDDKFVSIFSRYESVLNFGFTERDATPPGWGKSTQIKKEEKK